MSTIHGPGGRLTTWNILVLIYAPFHSFLLSPFDENDAEYRVLFSRVAGERSTYLLSNDDVEVYGDDAVELDDLYEDSEY